jgi:hypothetical protein
MRHIAMPRFCGVFTLLSAMAASASGQDPSSLLCKPGTDFEKDGYRIVHATVEDPFRFLYWKSVRPRFSSMLDDQLFTYKLKSDALRLIENARFTPNPDQNFVVRYERVDVENCDPNAKTLDVIFRVYSTDPPKFLGGATEAQQTAEKSPQTTAGLTQTGSPVHISPAAGYDRSDGFFGGGRIEIAKPLGKFHFFDTLTAEGQGSYSMQFFSAALSGSANRLGWLKHAAWRVNYLNYAAPAGATRLKEGSLSGQVDGETRPFWNSTFLARFGGQLQGGNMQSSVPITLIPPLTVSAAGYGSLKGYLGLSSRTTHNVFSVSYGLELGSVGPSARVDWRKHVGDIVDEFWVPIGDHKPLEVESRFTSGGIQVPHSIPLPARFFGGNGDGYFVPGDSWQIRDVPVIRAIPANRFYLTAAGAGADRFASLNLTFSYPVKSRPIMPKELSTDPELTRILHAQIVSAASIEQNYYTWKDAHFAAALNRLPNLKQLLDALQSALNKAQAARPGQLQDQFADCTTSIGTAASDVTDTLGTKGSAQYGDLAALLPADSDDLKSVRDACVGEVNGQLNDPDIGTAAAAVDAARTSLVNDFDAIDQKLAARKAAGDIAFVDRTLATLFKDLNIFSISPLAVFDSAWIGPAKGPLGGHRIGPGGGIRLELASYVNFTLGYAWNVGRQPGEGPGALFFSIGVRDLFH